MKTKSKMFSDWSEVTSGERNEIVFERLNKTYGAYEIRTNYDKTLLKAFVGIGLFILLLSAVLLFSCAVPIGKVEIPTYDTATFRQWEKEKEKTYTENRREDKNDIKKEKNDFPEVKKDTTPEKETTDIMALNNLNKGNSNDSGKVNNNLIGGDGGGDKGKKQFENDSTYDGPFIQEPPTFPGGDEALFAFLKKNISYPEVVKEIGGKGIVGISFIIDKEGNVIEASVKKASIYSELNNEALRVIKKLPKWNPGRQQGSAVKVRMILPIRFELKQ